MPSRRLAELVFQSATDYAIITTDLSGLVTFWSKGAEHVLGWAEEEVLSHSIDLIFTPEDRARDIAREEREGAARAGRGLDERWHLRQDGSRFWASGEIFLLKDEEGPQGFLKILRDRSKEKATEQELLDNQAKLALAIKAGRMALWELDLVQDRITPSPELNRVLGFPAEASPSMDEIRSRYAEGEIDRLRAEGRKAFARGERFIENEFRYAFPDASERWLLLRAEVRTNAQGQPVRVIGVLMDVTDRRSAEEQQAVLNHELVHRLKNQLLLVQGLVSQSLRKAEDLQTARKAINERLAVLSDAHELIIAGHDRRVRIKDLADQLVRLHQTAGAEQFRITGPDAELGSQAALSLALILHELATNALKYGALSTERGRVDLSWTVDASGEAKALELTWQERGGPAVMAPASTGFGSRLIKNGISGAGNTVTLDYAAEGLRCVISASLEDLRLVG